MLIASCIKLQWKESFGILKGRFKFFLQRMGNRSSNVLDFIITYWKSLDICQQNLVSLSAKIIISLTLSWTRNADNVINNVQCFIANVTLITNSNHVWFCCRGKSIDKKRAIWDERRKWSFPLRISSVNVTKSAISCGYG